MTNMESLYGSGKFTEIMQSVKLTEIKKISAEEVEFYTSEERFGIHGQLRKFMKGKNILKERKSLRLGGDFAVPNSRELLWQGSSEKTADMLFNALAEFSEKSKISFLVNYHSVEEEEINGEKKPVIPFHPEVIINGNRLINDFPDIDLNRRYIVLDGWKLVDITYSKPDSAPEPESLRAVVKKLCSKMLSALDKYFNVDYRVSLVFGTAKSEYTGLAPNIREAPIKTF